MACPSLDYRRCWYVQIGIMGSPFLAVLGQDSLGSLKQRRTAASGFDVLGQVGARAATIWPALCLFVKSTATQFGS